MPYPLPLTRTEAYLAYKAGVIQQSDLKPSLTVPRNGIDAWLAYWTGLAADYPKREDGTPHILQEEEAYIAYLCGVVSEYPEKCLRRVGAYLRYLISARWGRPDHPLNREELYLSLIKTQFIPSGDPSSDITIDGTAKAPFVDVKMYGDTFQQSYIGKNLFPSSVTWTINRAFPNSAQGEWANWAGYYGFLDYIEVEPDTTYTFSNAEHLKFLYGLQYYDSDKNWISGTNDAQTFTTPSDCHYIRGAVSSSSAPTQCQLEKGSTATAFEPYVGGIPSPNPDYPQMVQTVTGTQTVEVVGKNLFDKNHPNDSKCYVNNSGVLTSGDKQNLSVYIKCEPNTTYTVSKSNKGTNNRLCVFDTETEPAIGVSVISTVGTRVGEDNSPSYTITTGANAHYLGVFYRVTATTPSESEIKDTIQIEKGSTATAYESYISNDYEINLGKNLFNRNDVVNGIPSASDGSIISTSSAGRTSDYIPVMANTSYSHTGHSAGWATITWYKADKSFIQRVDNITTTTSPSGAAYARVSCAQSNLGTCQFEAGEPTNYAPYFEPIELCKLGTYQDYIWKDGENWKVHKATGQVTLNGTEDWYASQSSIKVLWINNPDHTGLGINDIYRGYTRDSLNGQAYMTCAVRQTVGNILNASEFGFGVRTENDGGSLSNAANALYVGFEQYTTVDAVKQYFASNNAVLYYQLNEATDTTITNTNLIAQLEALVAGGAENGTTYIKVNATDPNLPGLLYVEAAKYV